MSVLQFQSLIISLLLELIHTTVKRTRLRSCFICSDLTWLIKQMILVSIKKRFPNICRVSKFKNRMNTTLESVSQFVTSVSFGKSVLTQFTVARKRRIKFPWDFEISRRTYHQAFSSSVMSLCLLCICFSLLYTLRIRFPWYFRIPRRLDHQAFSFRVISSCLSFIFLSFPYLQWWGQHLT